MFHNEFSDDTSERINEAFIVGNKVSDVFIGFIEFIL